MAARSTSINLDIANPSKAAIAAAKADAEKLAELLSIGNGYESVATQCSAFAARCGVDTYGSTPFAEWYYGVFHSCAEVVSGKAKAWAENGRKTRFLQAATIGSQWRDFVSNVESAREEAYDTKAVTTKTLRSSPCVEGSMAKVMKVAKKVAEGKATRAEFEAAIDSEPASVVAKKAADLKAKATLKDASAIGLRALDAMKGIAQLLNGKTGSEPVVFEVESHHKILADAALLLAAIAYDDGAMQLTDDAKKGYVHPETASTQSFDHTDVTTRQKDLRGKYGYAKAKEAEAPAVDSDAASNAKAALDKIESAGVDLDALMMALKNRNK